MWRRTLRYRFVAPMGAMLLAAAGCSSPTSPSGQSTLSVAGSWVGTAHLPNAYDAILSLQQNGSAVSGTMRITGAVGDSPLTGTITPNDRTFTWRVNYDCQVWTGVLTIAADGREMDGPLEFDRSGCVPALSNGSGALSLSEQ